MPEFGGGGGTLKKSLIELKLIDSINDMNADAILFVCPIEPKEAPKLEIAMKKWPKWISDDVAPLARKRKLEPKSGSFISIDGTDGLRKTVLFVDKDIKPFEALGIFRKCADAAIFEAKVTRLVVDLHLTGSKSSILADAVVSAATAKLYKFPKYTTAKKSTADGQKTEEDHLQIGIISDGRHEDHTEHSAMRALHVTSSGTNLVRWLAKRAGNDLTCKSYMTYLKSLSKERRWNFKVHGDQALKNMNAGAFLSVVRGSSHKDYGIVELTYTPRKKSTSHLALVGKGMMFDTGGHCLKPSAYMLGMHGDMTGSAVALAVLNVATTEQWPVKISAYLAVADNMIGPLSYKPNDVVTSMKGTTIEIIDTDAEGRMVLADTLYLASKQKPNLIIDFATLTGACIRAIGTTYSGVFTNRDDLHASLIKAGVESGERVWPFPMDKDFAECLESTVADYKQCREKGGVDHIEAAQFLRHFVGEESPWVHVDLAAAEHAGGLAHVATDETGFGVRFATSFARSFFDIK
jgi:leucyl aminopeptidase